MVDRVDYDSIDEFLDRYAVNTKKKKCMGGGRGMKQLDHIEIAFDPEDRQVMVAYCFKDKSVIEQHFRWLSPEDYVRAEFFFESLDFLNIHMYAQTRYRIEPDEDYLVKVFVSRLERKIFGL